MNPLVAIVSLGIAGARCSISSAAIPGNRRTKLRNHLGIGLIALILVFAMPVLAQTNTGIISGRVTDPTGAVVPNAQITVTQTETNVDAASETNSDGLYRVPSLINGPYKVTVTAAGFKKQVRDGLRSASARI